MNSNTKSRRSSVPTEGKVNLIKRNLDDRYKNVFSITQELLQNADDAGAENVQIGLLNNFSTAHPLANTPGIFYINDGLLTNSNLNQIFLIGTSDKTDAPEKIGKFGLGMKSVFHICEAFFIFAYQTDGDLANEEQYEMFDPWDTFDENELLIGHPERYEWRQKFDENKKQLFNDISEVARRKDFRNKNWFCIWLPLRTEAQCSHSPICEYFPSRQEAKAQFSSEQCLRIAKMLPFMKYLKQIDFLGDLSDCGSIAITANRRFDGKNSGALDGKVQFTSKSKDVKLAVIGDEVYSNEAAFVKMLSNPMWPKIEVLQDGEYKKVDEKIQPQYAVALQYHPSSEPGLEIQYCVYLPLTDDEMRENVSWQQPMPISLSLYLHANLFVDAGRRKFETEYGESRNPIRMEWNRTILSQGVMPAIIPVIERTFKMSECWKEHQQITVFINAFASTNLFTRYQENICSKELFADILSPEGWMWTKLPATAQLYKLPESVATIHGMSQKLLSNVKQISFLNGSHSNLIDIHRHPLQSWGEAQVEKVLEALLNLPIAIRYQKTTLKFVSEFFNSTSPSLLTVDFLKRFLADIPSNEYSVKNGLIDEIAKINPKICHHIQFAQTFWERSAFSLWKDILERSKDVIPLPSNDEASQDSVSRYTENDVNSCLGYLEKKLQGKTTESERSVIQNLVCDYTAHSEIDIQNPTFSTKKIYLCDGNIYSLEELLDGHTFTSGGDTIRFDLQKLLPEYRLIFLQDNYSKAVNAGLKENRLMYFKIHDVNAILSQKPKLEDNRELRSNVISKLLPTAAENRQAIRYILHGNPNEYEYKEALWIPDVNEQSKAHAEWLHLLAFVQHGIGIKDIAIFPGLVGAISEDKLSVLGIVRQKPERILAELDAYQQPFSDRDFEWVTTDTYRVLLEDETVQDNTRRSCLKRFPIFPKRGGGFCSIDKDTFIENKTAIPTYFINRIKCLDVDSDYIPQMREYWNTQEWDATDLLTYAQKNEEQYSRTHGFVEELQEAIIYFAQDKLLLDDERKAYLRKQKILKVKNHPDEMYSFNDIIPLDTLDMGYEHAIEEYGLHYASELVQDLFPEHVWKYVRENLFLDKGEIAAILRKWLEIDDNFYAGKWSSASEESSENEIGYVTDEFCHVFNSCTDMPLATLLASLRKNEVPEGACQELLKCQSQKLSSSKYVKVCNYLAKTAKSSKLFMTYYQNFLRQAVSMPDFNETILPCLELYNERDELKSSRELTHSVYGISPEYQLRSDLTKIIPKPQDEQEVQKTRSMPVFEDSRNLSEADWVGKTGMFWEDIFDYFQQWDQSLHKFIGAMIMLTDSSPKVLENVKNYYLDTNPKTILELVNPDSKPEKQIAYNTYAFMKPFSGESVKVTNLLSDAIEVPLASLDDINNLLVGAEFYSCVSCHGYRGHRSFFLGLRKLTEHELFLLGTKRLEVLLKNTCTLICHNNCGKHCSVDELWKHLNEQAQFDLETAQDIILEHLIFSLHTLKPNHHQLREMLKAWDNATEDLAVAKKLQQEVNQAEAENNIKQIKKDIQALFENDEKVSKEIITALTNKMLKQYGYNVDSIPVELFQNADDASAEHLLMISQTRTDVKMPFILCETENAIDIIHWGRPINEYGYSGFTQGRELGFRNDLRKMMLLAQSDKEEDAVERTGKFGLGFKSVYLLCERPLVSSGVLKFSVKAGMFPCQANEDEQAELRRIVTKLEKSLQLSSDLPGKRLRPQPTLVHLAYTGENRLNCDRFKKLAPFLCIFSKAIATIKIETVKSAPVEYTRCDMTSPGCYEQKFGNQKFYVFKMQDAQLVLGNNNEFFAPIDKEIPNVWVTGPTQYRFKLGFAINASFTTDIGRTQLNANDPANLADAKKLGWQFYKVLMQEFSNEDNVNKLISLWDTMTKGNSDAYAWLELELHRTDCPGNILWMFFWGTFNELNGYGRFLDEKAAIPSGFEHDTSLRKLRDIKFNFDEIIASPEIWKDLRGLLKDKYDQLNIVAFETAQILSGIYPEIQIREISFVEAINSLCCKNNCEACVELLNKLPWDNLLSKIEKNPNAKSALTEAGKAWKFQNTGNNFMPLAKLVTDQADPKQIELFKFAPNSNKLHPAYNSGSLKVMAYLRDNNRNQSYSGNKDFGPMLAEWFISAKDDEKRCREAALYLINGHYSRLIVANINSPLSENDLALYTKYLDGLDKVRFLAQFKKDSIPEQRFINLMRTWFENNVQTPGSEDDGIDKEPVEENGSSETDDVFGEGDNENTHQYDSSIWQNWQLLSDDEKQEIIERINKKYYGTHELLPFPSSAENFDDRVRWMELFMLAMALRKGRTTEEQKIGFVKFCKEKGWFDVFAEEPIEDNKQKWIEVLEDFVNSNNEIYNDMMSLFPSIYQVSLYLTNYVQVLTQWNCASCAGGWQDIACFKTSLKYRGVYGTDIPTLTKAIGHVGLHWFFRELVRSKTISNASWHKFCFVPSQHNRELVFGDSNKKESSEFFEFFENMEDLEDKTFDLQFDAVFDYLENL